MKDRIGLLASVVGLLAAVASAAAVYIRMSPPALTNPESPAPVSGRSSRGGPNRVPPHHHPHR